MSARRHAYGPQNMWSSLNLGAKGVSQPHPEGSDPSPGQASSPNRGTPAVEYAPPVQLRVPLAAEIAAARGVAALSRLAGAGGGTTMPGKLLSKLDPGAIDRLAARLPAGAAVISATNGKTTTAAMAAEILEPRFRARPQPLGRQPRLGRRLDPPRLARMPSSRSSRWTKPRCPRCSGGSSPAPSASAISFATSSTATASSSSWRSAGARPSHRSTTPPCSS